MPTVSRGDLVFDVHQHGPTDGDPVLLLHGFPQRGTAWDAVAGRLATKGYRVLAPDQRGYSPGARPSGRRAYTLDEIAGDALAVVDELVGPGERVHVGGHDWGASVAWRLAARHPERLRSLSAVSVPPAAAFGRALLTTRQFLASWYLFAFQLPWWPERMLAAGERGFSTRLAASLRRSGQSVTAARRDATGLADPAALTAALQWYRAMFVERSAAEPRVRVPTLFVWSDGDTALTRHATDLVHRHVAGPFRYVELRGISHWVLDEAPDQLADLLLDQMAEYPG